MTARWSAQRKECQQAERLQAAAAQDARDLATRLRLLKLFRGNGWRITSLDFDGAEVPDDAATVTRWSLKMPGAYPVIVRSLEELRRKARGLRRGGCPAVLAADELEAADAARQARDRTVTR